MEKIVVVAHLVLKTINFQIQPQLGNILKIFKVMDIRISVQLIYRFNTSLDLINYVLSKLQKREING